MTLRFRRGIHNEVVAHKRKFQEVDSHQLVLLREVKKLKHELTAVKRELAEQKTQNEQLQKRVDGMEYYLTHRSTIETEFNSIERAILTSPPTSFVSPTSSPSTQSSDSCVGKNAYKSRVNH